MSCCKNDNVIPTAPAIKNPEVQMVSGPDSGSTVNESEVTFRWQGNEFTPEFSYKFGGSNWSSWTKDTSRTFQYLDERSYIFQIKGRRTDLKESLPISRTFSVDAVKGPSIMIEPRKSEVSLNEEFFISIKAEEVINVMLVKAELLFDSLKLEVKEIKSGDFLNKSNGQIVSFNSYDNSIGKIEINMGMAIGSPAEVDGTGIIASVKFKAKSTGNMELKFSNDIKKTTYRNSSNGNITLKDRVGGTIIIK